MPGFASELSILTVGKRKAKELIEASPSASAGLRVEPLEHGALVMAKKKATHEITSDPVEVTTPKPVKLNVLEVAAP